MTRLVFVFPAKAVGGVATLFVRVVNEINNNKLYSKQYTAFVVDYVDGFSVGKVPNDYIIEYSGDSQEIALEENSILIFQHSTTFRLFKNFKGNNLRCLFWVLHVNNSLVNLPYISNYVRSRPFSIFYKRYTDLDIVKDSYVRFTNFLIKKRGLIIMESGMRRFIKDSNNKVDIDDVVRVPIFFNEIKRSIDENAFGNMLYLSLKLGHY